MVLDISRGLDVRHAHQACRESEACTRTHWLTHRVDSYIRGDSATINSVFYIESVRLVIMLVDAYEKTPSEVQWTKLHNLYPQCVGCKPADWTHEPSPWVSSLHSCDELSLTAGINCAALFNKLHFEFCRMHRLNSPFKTLSARVSDYSKISQFTAIANRQITWKSTVCHQRNCFLPQPIASICQHEF